MQPSLAWTPRPSTRLAIRAGLAHETRDGIVDLGLGPLGTFGIIAHEYHASADHRVAERVTVTLAADGTHYTSGSTVTSGRAEVRASF